VASINLDKTRIKSFNRKFSLQRRFSMKRKSNSFLKKPKKGKRELKR